MSKPKQTNNKKFYQKMKTDKKYNAKVQIIAYSLFIILIIIFLNFNNINTTNSSINNIIDDITSAPTQDQEEQSLLKQINNNYEYDINITLIKNEELIEQHYFGKSFNKNIEINKEFYNETNKYYEIDGYYYIKNENNEFGLIQSNIIYDLVDEKYIELSDIIKLIDKASLEHVVDSSVDDKTSIYNLLVRDLVISNKSNDVITIKVTESPKELTINIDYTNLMKVLDSTIQKCEIEYKYTSINKVEEFTIMEESINTEQ